MTTRARLAALTLLLAAYAAVYARVVNHSFVWDDVHALQNAGEFQLPLGQLLRHTEAMRQQDPLATNSGVAINYDSYRPVAVASHWLDFALSGATPRAVHLHSLVLGALSILIAFAIARRWLNSDAAALVATAVFALHPIQVETIAYASARSDLLAGLFGLLAALLVTIAADGTRGRRVRVGASLAAALCYFLSLFAKEALPALPVALLLVGVALGRRRDFLFPSLGLLLVLPIYFGVRAAILGSSMSSVGTVSISDAVLGLPSVGLQYLAAFAVPLGLSIEHPLASDLVLPGWILLVAASIGFVALRLRRRETSRSSWDLPATGIAWTGLCLASASLAAHDSRVLSDRYAFVALFGFALLAGVAWEASAGPRRLIRAVVVAWLAALTFTTITLVPTWRDNRSLYSRALAMEPGSSSAHYRIGYLLARDKRWQEAEQELATAVAIDPANNRAINNLGVAYLNLDRLDDAESVLRRAIAINDGLSYRAWFNLGEVARLRGDPAAACRAYRQALDLDPNYPAARSAANQLCRAPNGAPNPPSGPPRQPSPSTGGTSVQ